VADLAGERRILTPDRRLRVFVSSTLQELAEERAAASEAISALRMAPLLFELGARPHPPQALYRSYLEQSDVFVGIYWQSYGWIAPGAQISGLEDELRLSSGKPQLVYVKEPAAGDRGWVVTTGGAFAMFQGDVQGGAAELARGQRLLVEAGGRRGVATAGLALSFISAPLHGVDYAQERLAETLAQFEELGDLWGIGSTLHAICGLRTIYDDYEGAEDIFERALAAVEEIGDDVGVALSLVNLANERLATGRHDDARTSIGRLLGHMHAAGITYAGDELLSCSRGSSTWTARTSVPSSCSRPPMPSARA
jgi:Domain of unknown function (DUF4062)